METYLRKMQNFLTSSKYFGLVKCISFYDDYFQDISKEIFFFFKIHFLPNYLSSTESPVI